MRMPFKRNEQEIQHEEVVTDPVYRTYKVRYFGLTMLVLLNIVTALNWTIFAPAPQFAADYFNTSLSSINWFANVYLLCYLVSSPLSSLAFERYSLKFGVRRAVLKDVPHMAWILMAYLIFIFIIFIFDTIADRNRSSVAVGGSMAPLFLDICTEWDRQICIGHDRSGKVKRTTISGTGRWTLTSVWTQPMSCRFCAL